jgi:hypothetical protein
MLGASKAGGLWCRAELRLPKSVGLSPAATLWFLLEGFASKTTQHRGECFPPLHIYDSKSLSEACDAPEGIYSGEKMRLTPLAMRPPFPVSRPVCFASGVCRSHSVRRLPSDHLLNETARPEIV